MVDIVSDKGSHYYVVDKNFRGQERRRKVKRFLCIGGGAVRSAVEIE